MSYNPTMNAKKELLTRIIKNLNMKLCSCKEKCVSGLKEFVFCSISTHKSDLSVRESFAVCSLSIHRIPVINLCIVQ